MESFVKVSIAAKFTALSIWILQFLRRCLVPCLECFNRELWWWPRPMPSSTYSSLDSQDFVTMTTALSGRENSSRHGKCGKVVRLLLVYIACLRLPTLWYDSMIWLLPTGNAASLCTWETFKFATLRLTALQAYMLSPDSVFPKCVGPIISVNVNYLWCVST